MKGRIIAPLTTLNNIICSNQILFIPANAMMKTTGPSNTVEYLPIVTKFAPVFTIQTNI